MVDGDVSHDQVTRFLSKQDFQSEDLWKALSYVNGLLFTFHLLDVELKLLCTPLFILR